MIALPRKVMPAGFTCGEGTLTSRPISHAFPGLQGSHQYVLNIFTSTPKGTPRLSTLLHPLNDPALFRQKAYVNGEWIDAKDGKTFDIYGLSPDM
jgi:hypothetical protein